MPKFEIINELTLKVTFDDGQYIHTKAGSMIGFQGDLKFQKELIGPGGNVGTAIIGQMMRRFTGENLELMKTTPQCISEGYFAFDADHVVIIDLQQGERIAVESENILAFTNTCKYGVMFLGTGVISQKGLATSTLEGPGQVAIIIDGNPIVLRGQSVVDPDAMIAFTGPQPTVGLDISWRNIIGQNSGESYNMKFNSPENVVIIQPTERKSGVSIGMDGGNLGQSATNQSATNQSIGTAFQDTQDTVQSAMGSTLGDIARNFFR